MRLVAISLLLLVTACPGPVDHGGEEPILVGPGGGTFVRACAALEIPPGAVEEETRIDVVSLAAGVPELSGRKQLGGACRLGPASVVLAQPITVTLAYPSNGLAEGVGTDLISMHRQGDVSQPVALETRIDTSIAVASASTSQLGSFWLTAPRDPLLEGLGVTPTDVVLRVGETLALDVHTIGLGGEDTDLVAVGFELAPARVASVSVDGVVTALAPGLATVTVRASKLEQDVTIRVQGDTRGPESFVHDTPFPTGNDLRAVTFGPDGSLWVAGDNTTLLTRDPAGAWTRIFSAPAGTLHAVSVQASGGLVAVGTAGTEGLLLTQPAPDAAPTVQRYSTALPSALWFDGTHGVAVGRGDDVLVLHDGVWAAEDSPSFEPLLAVIGDGAGGFVTLGNQGSLYVYDPLTRSWDSLFQARLATRLTAGLVAAPDGSEAWAVGGGQLWHFAHGTWTSEPLPPSPELTTQVAIALVHGELVVSGSHQGGGQLLRKALPGGAWSAQAMRGAQVIRAIAAAPASGGVAVGDLGAVWSSSGAAFVEVSRGFQGDVADVAAAPDGTVIAAVNDGGQGQVMLRVGEGGDWIPLLPETLAAQHGRVHAVVARGAGDLWAATDLGILHYSGGSWGSGTLTPIYEPIHDLISCADTVIAAGARGTFLIGTGPIDFAPAETTKDLYGVACSGTSSLWFAGQQVLIENGTDRSDGRLSMALWRAVYAPGPGEAWAFGDASYAVFWDTRRLRGVNAPGGLSPDVVHDVWGSGPDNVYAVGFTSFPHPFGFGLRFDGAAWRLIDAGASREVTSVDGWSTNDVWIGTRGGGVLRAVTP